MPRAVEVGSNIHEPPFGFGVKMRDSIRLLVLFPLASFLVACANDGKNTDSAHGGEHDSDVAQLIDSGDGTSGETEATDSAGGEDVAADGEGSENADGDSDGEGSENADGDSDGEGSENADGDSDGEGSENADGDSEAAAEKAAAEKAAAEAAAAAEKAAAEKAAAEAAAAAEKAAAEKAAAEAAAAAEKAAAEAAAAAEKAAAEAAAAEKAAAEAAAAEKAAAEKAAAEAAAAEKAAAEAAAAEKAAAEAAAAEKAAAEKVAAEEKAAAEKAAAEAAAAEKVAAEEKAAAEKAAAEAAAAQKVAAAAAAAAAAAEAARPRGFSFQIKSPEAASIRQSFHEECKAMGDWTTVPSDESIAGITARLARAAADGKPIRRCDATYLMLGHDDMQVIPACSNGGTAFVVGDDGSIPHVYLIRESGRVSDDSIGAAGRRSRLTGDLSSTRDGGRVGRSLRPGDSLLVWDRWDNSRPWNGWVIILEK
jgi:hypothetical protein